jgi:pilus assembly protein Flp/PilA
VKKFLEFALRLYDALHGDEGQDLVEYALLIALVALACTSGVTAVASAVTVVFSNISASLA